MNDYKVKSKKYSGGVKALLSDWMIVFLFVVLFLIIIALTVIIAGQTTKINLLIQEISILKKRIIEIEKNGAYNER